MRGDLRLRRQGQDLSLEMGGNDALTFRQWYRPGVSFGKTTLQVVTTRGKAQGVEVFDFDELVCRAEAGHAVRHGNSKVDRWTLTNALYAAFQKSRSDAALGGDLAWKMAQDGSLDGLSLGAVQASLERPGFGREMQSLQSATGSFGATDLRIGA